MDSVRFIIKECDEGEKFGKGGGNHVLEFFPRDTVELIREVEEDGGASGEGLFCCGQSIYFSIASCIALTTKSEPSGMPTAKLKGRRWVANLSQSVRAT